MIVKNISGSSRYLKIGPRGQQLANNAQATFPDTTEALVDAQRLVAQGVAQIVEAPAQQFSVGSVNQPPFGFIKLSGAAANNDTVTIKGKVFKFAASAGGVAAGEVWAGAGAAAGTAAGTLLTAIQANSGTTGVTGTAVVTIGANVYIPLIAVDPTADNAALTLAKSGTNIAVSAATLAAGVRGASRTRVTLTRTVSAGDVTEGAIIVGTGLRNGIAAFIVGVRRAGVAVAHDGVVQASGPNLVIDNSGSADLQAGDVITIMAEGTA